MTRPQYTSKNYCVDCRNPIKRGSKRCVDCALAHRYGPLPEEPNPSGMCMCGCGDPAPIATKTSRRNGWVKGKPIRYIHGHAVRETPDPYSVSRDTGCWEWQWSLTADGYGIAADTTIRNGRSQTVRAHRLYYERYKGEIPDGYQIDHLCRNRRCVNPDHLEAVPPAVNTRRSSRAKLTEDDVREIRRMAAEGIPYPRIGEIYGTSRLYIYVIVKRKVWKDVH